MFLLSAGVAELRGSGISSAGTRSTGSSPPGGTTPSPAPAILLSATASGSPTSGGLPLVVSFKGSASGGTSPYGYSWTFGGTMTSPLQNPIHTYLYAGSYGVTLTVTDAKKATAKATLTVTGSSLAGVASSLVGTGVLATTPSTFFSLDAVTNAAKGISTDAGIKSFLSASPFQWVRYGIDADSCNISAAKTYSSSGVASSGCGWDVSALQTWCNAQTPHCHSILSLPGENNNSAEDAAIAKWIVSTMGFQPDYWAIGNEPSAWTHYGIPWTKWRTTDASIPTPLAYAFDVKAAIAAVSKVDPAAKFIGIEAACDCNTVWFQDTAKINGAKIGAIAYHKYPSYGATTITTAQLYSLLSSKNLSTSLASVRALITGLCTTCATMPIFVNEYNAGPGWTPSSLAGTYANAVFLAGSVVQALRANLSQLSIFSLQTTFTGSYGYSLMDARDTVGPTGLLYSKLLNHLTLGQVLKTGVKTTVGGVWAVVTKNGAHESLLVVNTNLTSSIGLSLGTLFPLVAGSGIYQWNPSLTSPSTTIGLPSAAYSIPSQGILLITF